MGVVLGAVFRQSWSGRGRCEEAANLISCTDEYRIDVR